MRILGELSGMPWTGRRAVSAGMALAVLGMLPALSGCGAFFKCEGKASCPASGTTTATDTGDVVFAANHASTGIYAFYVSGSQMYSVAGEPFTTNYDAVSMAVSKANGFLFVAGPSSIYSYQVSSAGVLSNATAAFPSTTYPQIAMDVSADGAWLASIDSSLAAGPELYIYKIVSGTLTLTANLSLVTVNQGNGLTPEAVRFSPDNGYIAVALGGAGDLVVPFNDTTGAVGTAGVTVGTGAASYAVNTLAWDANDNLYLGLTTGTSASTGPQGVYLLPKADVTGVVGNLTITNLAHLGTTTGGPTAMTFASSYGFLYVANNGSAIDGFSMSGTAATPALKSLGASTAAPTAVDALTADSSGNYLFAAGTSGSNGLQLFSVGSDGSLTAENNAPTGSNGGFPVLAATH